MLSTVVFTDLSGSTEILRRVGDSRWRLLMAEHYQAARAEIEHLGGREIHTTGDGFLVLLDSPARAVRCAAAMIDAAMTVELMARAGVHTGEVEFQGDEVRGIAVHIAAHIGSGATRRSVRDHGPRPSRRVRFGVRRSGRV